MLNGSHQTGRGDSLTVQSHRSWCSRRLALPLLFFLLAFLTVAAEVPVAGQTNRVYGLQVHGVISQLTADHVLRVIGRAEDSGVPLVIEINSPGGVDSAIRRVTQAILGARVPIIVYVGPGTDPEAFSGAMFILLAANVAATAPDGQIGAAPPTGLTDRADQEEHDARVSRALQIATTTAEARGRNVETVTQVVRDERVLGATEALNGGLVDQVSSDITELLDRVSGTTVKTAAGNVELATADANVTWISMTWRERFLHAITDANVAYLLFSVGVLLLILALFLPARLLAGIPGALSLIVAIIALGNLPVSRLGLGLLIVGGLLFIAEQYSPRIGVPGTLGVIAYLIGSFLLYQPIRQTSPFAPDVRVNPWLVVGTVCFFVIALLLILRAIVGARRAEIEAAAAALIGYRGIVVKSLDPRGEVRIRDEEWAATTRQGPINEEEPIVVRGTQGATLIVEPTRTGLVADEPSKPTPSEAGGQR